ncbi:glycosyltransferase [Gloeobacter kilaueensis]|uniref:Glycosyl transferase family 2 n=1 Tax=Gloeobacter kilaueensis (strain ATCC BAA-2537 / CCAP 1431/1 / ULC 316 / JS1) TaxID=1183438 RepID=U5QI74_GLOK1|nr:glycosyltransferase [Gloeobacter kilaueensis]AGY58641.1 glycosyl transferase family 2 [Gloeobacter kilaueensis JS1]
MPPELLPFISIIVPVFNEEAELPHLLASLSALDWPAERLEILCVDNRSSDNSLALLLAAEAVTVLEEAKAGPYAARNRAIRQARGEFIAFTDADCQVSPGWLTELWQGFDDPRLGAVGGSLVPATVSNYVDYFEGCVFKSPNHSPGSRRIQPYLITANVMYRRSVFDDLGLFDEENFSGPDVEMSWRILSSGRYTLKILDPSQAIVYHRYRTRFTDFAYVLRRDAYGWFYLALAHPQMAPLPGAIKYFLKVLIGLAIYPWTTLSRACLAPIRRTPAWAVPQDLMRLAVLWNHFVGTLSAQLAHAGWQPPRALR